MIKVEKAKNNFTIEMRIFENYEKVKYEIIKVIDFLRHAETNLGMLGLWLLCVLCGHVCGVGYLGMPLIRGVKISWY